MLTPPQRGKTGAHHFLTLLFIEKSSTLQHYKMLTCLQNAYINVDIDVYKMFTCLQNAYMFTKCLHTCLHMLTYLHKCLHMFTYAYIYAYIST